MTRTRLTSDARKDQLLDSALAVATKNGLQRTTRGMIAEHAGVAPGLVTHYLGTMEALKRTIMRQAIRREVLPIVAEGLACRDKHAMKAPAELRSRALGSLQ